MPPGVIHCRDAGGHTPYIYGGRRPRLQGPLNASQVVTSSDHAELEAEVSGDRKVSG